MSETISVVIGAGMPVLISYLKRCTWTPRQRFLFSLGVCLVVGVAMVWAAGQLNLANIAESAGLVFTAATTVYKLWFEATPLNRELEQKDVL